jgi:hypothetical protein
MVALGDFPAQRVLTPATAQDQNVEFVFCHRNAIISVELERNRCSKLVSYSLAHFYFYDADWHEKCHYQGRKSAAPCFN